jgi:hypothetical protein
VAGATTGALFGALALLPQPGRLLRGRVLRLSFSRAASYSFSRLSCYRYPAGAIADHQSISILQGFGSTISHLSANWTPPPPPPAAPKRPVNSTWKPLFTILLSSLGLAVITCAGGFSVGKGPDGLGSFLLYAGRLFIGVFFVTLAAIVVYFFIWIVQKLG